MIIQQILLFSHYLKIKNMFRNLITLLFILVKMSVFSQYETISFKMTSENQEGAYAVADKKNKKIVIFINEPLKIKAYYLNEQMILTDSLAADEKNNNYKKLIGHNINNNSYRLFWTTKDNSQVMTQVFDFETKIIKLEYHNLNLTTEKIIQKFSTDTNFYVTTINKKTNSLKFYVFDNFGRMEEKIIDIKNLKFVKANHQHVTFYEILNEHISTNEKIMTIQYVNSEYPQAVTESSKKRKFYLNDDVMYITFDNNLQFTQILAVDLKSFTASQKLITQTIDEIDVTNSNSFLQNGGLLQIASANKEFNLTFKSLNNDLLKNFKASNIKSIDFKNTQFLNSYDNYGHTIEYDDDQSKFIKALNLNYLGISCYKVNDNYLLTIGAVTDVQTKNGTNASSSIFISGAIPAFAFALTSYIVDDLLTKQITPDIVYPYLNRRVNSVNCLFDSNNNHVVKKLNVVVFDKIQEFNSKTKANPTRTFFKFENDFYVGQYEKIQQAYFFRKFSN